MILRSTVHLFVGVRCGYDDIIGYCYSPIARQSNTVVVCDCNCTCSGTKRYTLMFMRVSCHIGLLQNVAKLVFPS